MSDSALAWIDTVDPARLRWRGGGEDWRSGSYAEFGATLAGREALLLLDGAAVTLMLAELPVGDARTARQALPYAVEERLAQPLEQVHLAHVPLGAGRYLVAAIARTLHDAIAVALGEAGLKPRLVAPEYCALPLADGAWSIVLDDGTATLRTAVHAGLKIELATLATLVPQLRRECPATARIDVYADARQQAAFPHAAFQGLEVVWHAALDDAVALATLAAAPPLTLIDQVRNPLVGARVRRLWGGVAIIALIVALAAPLMLAFENHLLERAAARLSTANAELFKATFPEATRVVNPRVQADQALATLRAQADAGPHFLDLLARVDAVHAGGFPPGTRLATIAYSDGVLELGIETPDMDAIERVRGLLRDRGLAADMLSAESGSDKVLARLRLREAP